MKASWWCSLVGALLLTIGLSVALADEPAEIKEEPSVLKKEEYRLPKKEEPLFLQKRVNEMAYAELRDRRSKLQSEIPRLEQEIQKLQSQKEELMEDLNRKPSYERRIKLNEQKLKSLAKSLETSTQEDKKIIEEKLRKLTESNNDLKDRLKYIMDELSNTQHNIKQVEANLDNKQTELSNYKMELEAVENSITKILDIMRPKQAFKTNMSIIFAVLVGIVIVGFFVIAYYDETVRRAIFSGTAGIQFVTLFSLVIAIILFGIIDILEGKELAALLGGLSGYILGRATSEK